MNQEQLKGKWADIKDNAKDTYKKVKEDVTKMKENVSKKDFAAGVDKAKEKINEFRKEKNI